MPVGFIRYGFHLRNRKIAGLQFISFNLYFHCRMYPGTRA
jgi:hypothetical protein